MDCEKTLSKEELSTIADELINSMRGKSLPIWQVKEALKIAIERIEWEPLNRR